MIILRRKRSNPLHRNTSPQFTVQKTTTPAELIPQGWLLIKGYAAAPKETAAHFMGSILPSRQGRPGYLLQKAVGAKGVDVVGGLAIHDHLGNQLTSNGRHGDTVALMTRGHVETGQSLDLTQQGQAVGGVGTEAREEADHTHVLQRGEETGGALHHGVDGLEGVFLLVAYELTGSADLNAAVLSLGNTQRSAQLQDRLILDGLRTELDHVVVCALQHSGHVHAHQAP